MAAFVLAHAADRAHRIASEASRCRPELPQSAGQIPKGGGNGLRAVLDAGHGQPRCCDLSAAAIMKGHGETEDIMHRNR